MELLREQKVANIGYRRIVGRIVFMFIFAFAVGKESPLYIFHSSHILPFQANIINILDSALIKWGSFRNKN